MKQFISVLLFASTSALAAPCLNYSSEVTLQGTLSRHTFPEQPNYESIAKGDAKASYFFISPHESICVNKGTNDDVAEQKVKRIQLVFLGEKDSYGPLRPYLGKVVVCRGSLFHAISGHHHSPVLLSGATCSSPTHHSSGTPNGAP